LKYPQAVLLSLFAVIMAAAFFNTPTIPTEPPTVGTQWMVDRMAENELAEWFIRPREEPFVPSGPNSDCRPNEWANLGFNLSGTATYSPSCDNRLVKRI
jgi:hypothetical protein